MGVMRLEVKGVGLVTAIGHSASQTASSLAAGVRRFRQTHLVGTDGKPIVGACVLADAALSGVARGLAMARVALDECVRAGRANDGGAGRAALVVCGRGTLPGALDGTHGTDVGELRALDREWAALPQALADELERTHGVSVPHELRLRSTVGHASGIAALSTVQRLFARGDADCCLLVGADSLVEPRFLEWLDLSGAIHHRGSTTGFVPGEAAAALWVERAPAGPLARPSVVGYATARERREAGVAATRALDLAIRRAGIARARIGRLFTDHNGERRRAEAWPLAATRALWTHAADPEHVHPASSMGDVGGATGVVLMALSATSPTLRDGDPACDVVLTSDPGMAHAAAVVAPAGG